MAYIPKVLRESGYINTRSRIPMSDQVKILELYCDPVTNLSMMDVAQKVGVSKGAVHQWLVKAEDLGIINYATREKLYENDLKNLTFTKREESRLKLAIEKEQKRKEENVALADRFEQFVDSALGVLNSRDLTIEKTDVLVKAAGTAVDKMRLLREESTKNVVKQRKSIVEIWSQVDAIPLEKQLEMIGEHVEVEDAKIVEAPVKKEKIIPITIAEVEARRQAKANE